MRQHGHSGQAALVEAGQANVRLPPFLRKVVGGGLGLLQQLGGSPQKAVAGLQSRHSGAGS